MTNHIELEIRERGPFAGGTKFDASGGYERMVAKAHYRVDPRAGPQSGVTDIAFAPRDADGLVRFAADVFILQPADPALGNSRLLFDWGNRGNKRALQYFCDAPHSNDPVAPEHAGNGFLFRRGYTIVFGAWQGDLLPGDGRMLLDLPVARNPDGPITGPVRTEFITDEPGVTCLPLSGRGSTRSHPAVSADTRQASLTVRPVRRCGTATDTGRGLVLRPYRSGRRPRRLGRGLGHRSVGRPHPFSPGASARAGSTNSSTRPGILSSWDWAMWPFAIS